MQQKIMSRRRRSIKANFYFTSLLANMKERKCCVSKVFEYIGRDVRKQPFGQKDVNVGNGWEVGK